VTTTTSVEILSIGQHGFWLSLGGRQRFLPFTEFPWFAGASVRQILNVRRPSPDHLYWPELDVDLAVKSIDHPERFPLRFDPPHASAG
jgi:hypothetical protein